MRIIIRCALKISLILFLFVGCGYNIYYWGRFAQATEKPKTQTIEDDIIYYDEPLEEDTIINDTTEEINTNI